MKPTFGSAFAGIGGFELGLERAGWECRWQIENDKACIKILEKHWPNVRRYSDVEEVNPKKLEAVDLLCGGFPCQDLSVAGKRGGLSGERSGLFWELVRLARGVRPRWLLIENVPGFLSSHEGEDFALAIETLAECGYGLAWRVLDSQYFGVPQRRRRVFIVGHLGAICPPEILFESEGGEGHIAKGGKTGEDIAYCLRECPSHSGDKGDGGLNTTLIATLRSGGAGGIPSSRGEHIIAGFSAGQSAGAGSIAYEEERSPTLKGEPSGTNRVPSIIYHSKGQDFDLREYEGICPAVTERWGTGGCNVPYVGEEADSKGVREASRVPRRVDLSVPLAFDWRSGGDVRLNISEKQTSALHSPQAPAVMTKEEAIEEFARRLKHCLVCPDSPRYRALGNAVTVQVVEWIGRRILEFG